MASRLDGDVWNIVDNDKNSQHYRRNFKFDFSYISSKEIKDVVPAPGCPAHIPAGRRSAL